MSQSSSFLSHVNGMRALAILGILFYHLNAAYCPAGYFGVDVFLVISGYFLLGSLMKAQSPSDIHYGSYLLKKSWRIIPSWFIVTCVFYFGAAYFMIPEDRLAICNTASRSAFFGADFYIDSRYDYFNQKAHENLFLHYWYLSLICQMYIIVPLLMMLLLRLFSRRVMVAVLGLIGLASFGFYLVVTTPQVSQEFRMALLSALGMKTAYYHLVPRLWEILAGGAVLLLPAWPEKRWLRMSLETLGAVGMVASFYLYSTGSPQVYLAVVSAILMIRYGGEGWVSRLLSLRPVQWVGTISFSLYLWHWPLMAGLKYVKLNELMWYDELGLLLASFLLAWVAWRYIERLKMPEASSRLKLCLRFLPLLLLLFFAVGTRPYYKAVRASQGQGMAGKGGLREMEHEIDSLPKDEDLLKGFADELFLKKPAYIGQNSQVPPTFFLVGDSHSLHTYHGLHQESMKRGIRGIYFNNLIVPFWRCRWSYAGSPYVWNQKRAEALEEYLREHDEVKDVFFVVAWQLRLYGTPVETEG